MKSILLGFLTAVVTVLVQLVCSLSLAQTAQSNRRFVSQPPGPLAPHGSLFFSTPRQAPAGVTERMDHYPWLHIFAFSENGQVYFDAVLSYAETLVRIEHRKILFFDNDKYTLRHAPQIGGDAGTNFGSFLTRPSIQILLYPDPQSNEPQSRDSITALREQPVAIRKLLWLWAVGDSPGEPSTVYELRLQEEGSRTFNLFYQFVKTTMAPQMSIMANDAQAYANRNTHAKLRELLHAKLVELGSSIQVELPLGVR